MSSPPYLCSPLPQRMTLDDALMQESRILPCDRDARFGSLLTRKGKDVEIALTTSSIETDSIVSSCMLTSESFYCQVDGSVSVHRCEINPGVEYHPVTNESKINESKPLTPVNESPPPKLRKRRVDWGDRHSIRLSIEYPKSMVKESTLEATEKLCNAGYFKICFGTEFSDEDNDEEGDNKSEEDNDTSITTASKVIPIDCPASVTSCSRVKKPKRTQTDVWFLSATTSNLIGALETEDGMLLPQSLANLSIPQIQLIVNDLLNRIHEANLELMTELSLRDDLNREKEEKHTRASRDRPYSGQSPKPYHTPPLRPNNLKFSDAFNPNPEHRYPFNSTQPRGGLDSHHCSASKSELQTPNPVTVGARLRAHITRFFSPRISCQSQPLACNDANDMKSMSF